MISFACDNFVSNRKETLLPPWGSPALLSGFSSSVKKSERDHDGGNDPMIR